MTTFAFLKEEVKSGEHAGISIRIIAFVVSLEATCNRVTL